MEHKIDRNVNAGATSVQRLIHQLKIVKGMLQNNHFLVMTHGASQLSKVTHVVNNNSEMSGLFESINYSDFEGNT